MATAKKSKPSATKAPAKPNKVVSRPEVKKKPPAKAERKPAQAKPSKRPEPTPKPTSTPGNAAAPPTTKARARKKLSILGRVRQVVVHNRTKRDDRDVLEGHRCQVTAGEHEGLVGTFISVTEYGEDGYPLWVVVRGLQPHGTAELVGVRYKDIKPVDPAQS